MNSSRAGDSTLRFGSGQVEPSELASLCASAGWYVLPPANYRKALAGTYFSLSARDSGGRLVGYGRIVSDGGVYAWIHDLVVLPERRGQGIGSRLLTGLIQRAEADGIPYLGLFAAKGRARFYERFGFRPRPGDAPGMFLWFAPD